MVQYNKEVKALVDKVAVEIMSGTLTQKRLMTIMAKLYKDLDKPTQDFLKRVYKMADNEAWKEELATVSSLMVKAKTKGIKSITKKEIKIISEYALTRNLIFTKWKNTEHNGFVSDVYNLEDSINALPKYIRDNYRQRALAGMIAGDTPAQVANSLVDRNLNKKIHRNIKTLYETTKYKARSLANLKVLQKNEEYFDFYDFKTMEDDRVETVCLRLEAEADKEKWITYDDVPVEAYTPVHFNCRCKIEAGFSEDIAKDLELGKEFNFVNMVITDEAKVVMNKVSLPDTIERNEAGEGSYYIPITRSLSSQRDRGDFMHEYGHHIDYRLGTYKTGLSASLLKDAYVADSKLFDTLDYTQDALTHVSKALDNNFGSQIADLYDSFTSGRVFTDLGLGHGSDYWKKAGNREAEAMANMFELWSNPYGNGWTGYQKLAPNLSKAFLAIIEDIKNEKIKEYIRPSQR